MDSEEEAILAIFIGTLIAGFLKNTGRVLQAIEVYEECLIILHSQVLSIDSLLANTMFRTIYLALTCAYGDIKDYTSTEKYLRKLLPYLDSNDTAEKGWLHLKLADILRIQNRLMEAWKFYESAIDLMKTIRNTQGRHGVTKTSEQCSNLFVNMTRPENIRRKHLLSVWKLATGMEKQQATET